MRRRPASRPVEDFQSISAASSEDPTDALSVSLLGPLEVSIAGKHVDVRTGRLRTLLAVLAMSAGKTVSVDRLALALWGGDLPVNKRRSINTYVTRLRGMLGPERISTTPGGYVLNVDRERVDALRFIRTLDAITVGDDPIAERARLVAALGLWRGMPFE